MLNRKFGVEMEIIGITREQALRAMTAIGVEDHAGEALSSDDRPWGARRVPACAGGACYGPPAQAAV